MNALPLPPTTTVKSWGVAALGMRREGLSISSFPNAVAFYAEVARRARGTVRSLPLPPPRPLPLPPRRQP